MTSSSRLLVINADDFGYSAEANSGIIECFRNKAVSRASLLVNGIAAKQGCDDAARVGLPLGLHLNLTEGLPVSKETLPTLCNKDGEFLGKMGTRERLQTGSISPEEIRFEMEEQIKRFKKLTGYLPDFIDGHQHVHILTGVREIFSQTLQKYGITWTRLPLEYDLAAANWLDSEMMTFNESVIKDSFDSKPIFQAHGVRFSDCFVGLSTMGTCMTPERLQYLLLLAYNKTESSHQDERQTAFSIATANYDRCEQAVTCELMVHVGYPTQGDQAGCGTGVDAFWRSSDRQHEINVLSSPVMRNFYKECSIRLQ